MIDGMPEWFGIGLMLVLVDRSFSLRFMLKFMLGRFRRSLVHGFFQLLVPCGFLPVQDQVSVYKN